MDAGVTVDQIQSILIAVAPIVGTPRTLDAALNITEALGSSSHSRRRSSKPRRKCSNARASAATVAALAKVLIPWGFENRSVHLIPPPELRSRGCFKARAS